MKAIELAKALGEGIAEDPVILAYDEAKAAFEADAELAAQMTEYNTHRTCLAAEFNKDLAMQEKDVIESLKEKMNELSHIINQNENYTRYAAAQNAVNDLMQRINATISYYAFGVEPSNCTHDCSTCGGCH